MAKQRPPTEINEKCINTFKILPANKKFKSTITIGQWWQLNL